MNSFRPEVGVLLECARTCLDAERQSRIKSLISTDIDWTYLLRLARGHGVTPLLYRNLNSTCPDAVAKDFLQELRNHFYANAGRNLFLTEELINLLRLFQIHEIACIPYKGPVLASSLYGNLTLREFGDLDILVRAQNYPAAQRLLMARGYGLTKQFEHESTVVDSTGRIAVDLHRAMTDRDFSSPLDFEYLWGRRQHVKLAGSDVFSLSPGDTLLMLAIQITKDSGSRYLQLSKICDIAELLRAYPQLDLAQVVREARRLGSERMLLYSLRLANSLLGTILPKEITSEMHFHPALGGLVEYARRQLFDASDSAAADQRAIERFRWRIRERVRDKLHPYYLRYVTDVIVPCELEHRLLPLPRKLYFFYYFIRPVRLIGKHLLLQMKQTVRGAANHDFPDGEASVETGGSQFKRQRGGTTAINVENRDRVSN